MDKKDAKTEEEKALSEYDSSFSEGAFRVVGDSSAPLGDEARYDEIFNADEPKTKIFSVISFILGLASIFCCAIGWLGISLGVLAVAFAILSRINLSYFDGVSISGLMLGIFGIVFGIMAIVVSVTGFDSFSIFNQ